jgi:hypothetical protein
LPLSIALEMSRLNHPRFTRCSTYVLIFFSSLTTENEDGVGPLQKLVKDVLVELLYRPSQIRVQFLAFGFLLPIVPDNNDQKLAYRMK